MSTLTLELEDDLAALLHQANRPLPTVVREMIVLELYRRGSLSSGRAAELVGMNRLEFIHHAARLGVSYIDLTDDEWKAERASSETI